MNIRLFNYNFQDLQVIYCPELDMYSYGTSFSQARERFSFTLTSHLNRNINPVCVSKINENFLTGKKLIETIEIPII